MQVASVHHEYGRLTLATAGLLFMLYYCDNCILIPPLADIRNEASMLLQLSQCPSESTTATVRTQSRHLTLTTPKVAAEKSSSDDVDDDVIVDFGTLISAHSHTSRTHTVETTTVRCAAVETGP